MSLLFFQFNAQARADSLEFPGPLAALYKPGDHLKKEIPASHILPTRSESFKGTPTVLGRNGIQIPINEPLVQKYIRFYEGDGRRTFSEAMEKGKYCLPQMTEILESHGVPAELVYVVLVESRFEKHASYRGAGGYWQMLASTAKRMGLKVDRWVDERRDPIKSTKAAAKYLKTLYDQHDSWLLALAAYNAGSRPIAYAARRGRVKDGELYGRKLPARSVVYVSKVLAAMAIMREPGKYGFELPNYCKPKDFDPVMVKAPLKLEEIARWIDVPVSQLQELNPSLRLDAMPPDSGFALRLPSGSRDKFDLAYEVSTRR
ncbi:MAG: lytic transglycosylase domain-containing protein [Desulfobacteraceae bacterium]|nr:lytic transglycosylase domain-containing protein [Desulfobacteraceae bacterium]